MADIFWGADRGDQVEDIVRAAASPTKDVEVVIDDAVSLTKSEVLLILDQIKERILRYPSELA